MEKPFQIDPFQNVIPFRKVRKQIRFHTELKFEIISRTPTGLPLQGQIINFSSGGVAIKSDSILPEIILVKVHLGPDCSSVLQLQLTTNCGQVYGARITAADQSWNEFMTVMSSDFNTNPVMKLAL